MEFPTHEETAKKVAETALDSFEYQGKSIREWMKIIAEQEPCDDAISRQAVLDLIEHYNSDGLGSVFFGYKQGVKFADAVNKLPSVKPQYTDAEIQKMQEPILDKIRVDIEKLNPVDYGSISSYESHNGARDMKEDVLSIIDKYIKESEVDE